jgi:hypothetical protein
LRQFVCEPGKHHELAAVDILAQLLEQRVDKDPAATLGDRVDLLCRLPVLLLDA